MAGLLDLPAELLLQILSYLRVDGNIPRHYSGICRRLQLFLDSEYLRVYSLRSPNYHHFKATFSVLPYRRRSLKVLNYCIVLPEYNRHTVENDGESSMNNKAFLNALVPLFKILNTWEENGSNIDGTNETYGFTLALQAVAKPRFSREIWALERGIGHVQIPPEYRRQRELEQPRRLSHRSSLSGSVADEAFDWPWTSNENDYSTQTPRSYPRVSSVSLPPGAENTLPTINCVRNLEVVQGPAVPTSPESNGSEYSRHIDCRVLKLLGGRMLGLRPVTDASQNGGSVHSCPDGAANQTLETGSEDWVFL